MSIIRDKINSKIIALGSAGVTPRLFPTNVSNIFTVMPTGNIPNSGIAPRIAARPNSAPMLDTANYYTQIPSIGLLMGMPSINFRRATDDVHRSAVSDVQHVIGVGVHPTVRRKVLMGDKSL